MQKTKVVGNNRKGRRKSVVLESIEESKSNTNSPSQPPQNNSESSETSNSLKCSRSSHSDEYYSIQEVICQIRDAIVSICSFNKTADQNYQQGNGFFISHQYIICPSSLVLNKPNSETGNKFNFQDVLLITISNVNQNNISYTYWADVIGIDGAGNIAVLSINYGHPWNKFNPELTNLHPFLKWGKSRNTSSGDQIMVIGEITGDQTFPQSSKKISGASENGVSFGVIADNRYVAYNGIIPGELLLLSNLIMLNTNQGLPILTLDGYVVGMYIHSSYNQAYMALSEFFMRRSIKALLSMANENSQSVHHYAPFVESIINNDDHIYRFNKGWLGVVGYLWSQEDYLFNLQSDGTRLVNLEFTNQPKRIQGYRVTGIITDPINSPLLDLIEIGDLITHIGSCPLGDRKGQISPSLVMWRIKSGTPVKIIFFKQKENFNTEHEIEVIASEYCPFLDYPWYSFNHNSQITLI